MGRELRRKQAKKDGKSLEKEEVVEELQLRRYVIIVLVIILILSALYILSSLFITKELDWLGKKEDEVVDTNTSDDILVSDIFSQQDAEYYVYFYDFNETESVITNMVATKLTNVSVYRVNTSSVMNAKYISDVGNKKAKKLSELKIVSPTLIKITDGVITEYYETNEIIKLLS